MKKTVLSALLMLFILGAVPRFTSAAPEASAGTEVLFANLTAEDMPYDDGHALLLTWGVAENPPEGLTYEVYASTSPDAEAGWTKVNGFVPSEKTGDSVKMPFWAWKYGKESQAVQVNISELAPNAGQEVALKVKALSGDKVLAESAVVKAVPVENWFRTDRLNNFIGVVLVTIAFFLVVSRAKKKGLFVRRIAGLDAIEEAIGRATEMGKPIYYTTGLGAVSQVSTIASLSIMSEVAKKVAQYDSIMKIPHYDPIVMSVAKETVKQAYLEAGRSDSYRDDFNFFVSSDQFSYAASVDGMIDREKPAACFFMGYFMAESLLLTEVGSSTGAIQIAGTDSESQLPFFFTSCDYTLIGEELYAAGAYLSKEPMLLSVLKLQDFGKLVMIISVVFGGIAVAVAGMFHADGFINALINLFTSY